MSSRALRKLQREQEEKSRLQQLEAEAESDDEVEQESPVQAKKKNAFSFLDAAEEDKRASDPDPEENTHAEASEEDHEQPNSQKDDQSSVNRPPKKKAKKKKKKAARAKSPSPTKASSEHEDNPKLDEIDVALKALKTHNRGDGKAQPDAGPDRSLQAFYELLAVDSKHLNALNEMRKLFGSTVLANESSEAAAARRRGRGPQALDLGAALAGRNNPVSRGQGLSGLAVRRNTFIPGKEDWPKATSGGLGMELVEKAWDYTTEYRFVHSKLYQGVQKDFERSVETLDPQNMITLLQLHPYHISTLVQVSELAKHQGDHAVAGNLLERALFTFGRSIHSSFGTAIAEGKARLDFRRFQNREFWLAGWRYISSLGQRGTWRTAFEWAKLLLSLDPEGDPLCMHLILDQLAIRGGEYESLIKLAGAESINWGQQSPNIQISLALAHYKLKHASKSREVLGAAIGRFPWIFIRLFQELNIEHTPKSIWGCKARTGREELLAESYAIRAKDMWNVPEALSLLVEVAESVDRSDPPPPEEDGASLNEARHFILAEVPALLAFLPRSFTRDRISATDPLPPEDDIVEASNKEAGSDGEDEENNETVDAGESSQSWLGQMWSRFVSPNFARTWPAQPTEAPPQPTANEMRIAMADALMGIDTILTDELLSLNARQREVYAALQSGKLPPLPSQCCSIKTHVMQASSSGRPLQISRTGSWSTLATSMRVLATPSSTSKKMQGCPGLLFHRRSNPLQRHQRQRTKPWTTIKQISGGLRAEVCCS